ncbi:unannotated protein [freshwater metagenome]|uniref:Unannotated protein n=1 Tax=freshwater metagenome TaxID=449393 RepID=A0A6J7XRU5_9ZZZZ|nr:response regulator SirA [Actinomycetota bacterium]
MKEIDARGLLCPLPIINLGKAMSQCESGDELLLHSDDPATQSDLNAWSRMTGNTVNPITATSFLIVKK